MEKQLYPVPGHPFRVLDVLQPLFQRESIHDINKAEMAFDEWAREREKLDIPIIHGRFGVCRCRSADGGAVLRVLSFTAHLKTDHPLFDKPDDVAAAMDELLTRIEAKYVLNSNTPALIYYADGTWVWQRSKFPPEQAAS